MSVELIQSGQVTLSDTNSSVTDTVAPYVASKCLLIFQVKEGDANPSNSSVSAEKTNSTTLTFRRQGTAGDLVIEWQLIQDNFMAIQDVSYTADGTDTISAVTLSQSFVVTNGHAQGGATQDNSDFVELSFDDSTTVRHSMSSTKDSAFLQVVDYRGANVQTISNNVAAATTTVNETISSVTESNTMLWGTFLPTGAGTVNFDQIFKMLLTSPTNVQLLRTAAAPTTWDYTIFAVEFPSLEGGRSGWNVQRGTESFSTTDQVKNVSIATRNLAVSFAQCTGLHSGCLAHCQSDSATDDYGDNRVTSVLTSPTNLQLERVLFVSPGPSLQVSWEVADLTPVVYNAMMFGNNV